MGSQIGIGLIGVGAMVMALSLLRFRAVRGASEDLFSHGICPDCAARLSEEAPMATTGYNPG